MKLQIHITTLLLLLSGPLSSQSFYVCNGTGKMFKHNLDDCSIDTVCTQIRPGTSHTFLPNGDHWDFQHSTVYAKNDTNCNLIEHYIDFSLSPSIEAVVSDENGTIWCLGNLLLKFDPTTHTWEERVRFPIPNIARYISQGGAIYHQRLEQIYHINDLGEIYQTDTLDIRNSLLISRIREVTDINEPIAMIYKRYSCLEDKVYVYLLETGWHEVDIFTGEITLLCALTSQGGKFMGEYPAIPWDILPSDCELSLDLDVMDKTHPGADSRAYLDCFTNSSRGVDLFPSPQLVEVFSESSNIDSLRFQLLNSVDTGERLEFNKSIGRIQNNGNGYSLVIPSGQPIDYQEFIANIRYINSSCPITLGSRNLQITIYRDQLSSSANCEIIINSITPDAGKDTTIYFCNAEDKLNLYTAIDSCVLPQGKWSPPLTSPGVFDPQLDQPGIYQFTVSDPKCGIDTAFYEFISEEYSFFETDTIYFCDSVLVQPLTNPRFDIEWNNGDRSESIWIFTEGHYTAQFIRDDGCIFLDSLYAKKADYLKASQASLEVNPNETITISPSFDPLAIETFFIEKQDTVYSTQWTRSFSTSTSILFCQKLLDGCLDCIDFEVTLTEPNVFIPNVFSPNGDQLNDVLTLISSKRIALESAHIYDRWGALVYQSGTVEGLSIKIWDGTINGVMANPGVYTFIIAYRSDPDKKIIIHGSVTVIH